MPITDQRAAITGLNVQCEDVISPVPPNWRSFNLHIKRVEASIGGHYERARCKSHLVEFGPTPAVVECGPGLFTCMNVLMSRSVRVLCSKFKSRSFFKSKTSHAI